MVININARRFGAVFLCLIMVVAVVYQSQPKVRADAVVLPILGTVALAFTLLTICGVTFESDSGALAAANDFVTKINNYATLGPIWAALKAKQAAGEAIEVGADSLKSIYDFVFGPSSDGALGLTPDVASGEMGLGIPVGLPLENFGLSDELPFYYFGEPLGLVTSTGTVMICDYSELSFDSSIGSYGAYVMPIYGGTRYLNTGELSIYSSTISYFGVRLNSTTRNYLFMPLQSYIPISSSGTATSRNLKLPYITQTGVNGELSLEILTSEYATLSSSYTYTHAIPLSWIDQQRLALSMNAAYNSAWANGVLEKLADLEGQIIGLPNILNPEAGKTVGDVVPDWVDDVINPPWAGDVVTRDTLLDLFIPREGFLAAEFDDMLDKFPQLADLAPLEGLRTLGERKPEFRIKINNYFGINTDQKGIDIDLWDDKRYIFKAWIRAFLIILTIIYIFNQCYKLIRSGSFTDTGTSEGKSVTSPKGGKGK